MPIEYPGGGVVREHTAVRERVGIFDVSHLGKASVTGPGAADFVNACLTNDLGRIQPGQAQYTLCCDESGGVVDDLIAYLTVRRRRLPHPQRRQHRRGRAPPAGRRARGHRGHRPAPASTACIAVQGPRSDEVLAGARAAHRARLHVVRRGRLAGPPGHRVPHRLHRRARLRAGAALGRRAGPVGRAGRGRRAVRRAALRARRPRHPAHRDGLPVARQRPQPRHHARAGPRGLGRRLEEGRLLGPATRSWPRRPAGARRTSWGLLATGRGIPRAHCQVKDAHGEPLGEVTSGTFSPTLKQGIALALLAPGVAEGDEVVIDVRGREVAATVVKPAVRAGPDAARRARPLSRAPGRLSPAGPPAARTAAGPGSTGGLRPGLSRRAAGRLRRSSTATANPVSTTAPRTSPVIPPTRWTARRTTTEPATTAAARTTGPAHQRRPAREPAAAEKAAMATVPAIRAGAPTVPATVAPRPSERAEGTPPQARPGQQRAAREHRDAGERTTSPRPQERRECGDVEQQHQGDRGDAARADVAAPHDLQRPLAVVSGGEPVGRVGEPVQVHRPRAEHEDGDRHGGEHGGWRADQAADGGHGQDAEGERQHRQRSHHHGPTRPPRGPPGAAGPPGWR